MGSTERYGEGSRVGPSPEPPRQRSMRCSASWHVSATCTSRATAPWSPAWERRGGLGGFHGPQARREGAACHTKTVYRGTNLQHTVILELPQRALALVAADGAQGLCRLVAHPAAQAPPSSSPARRTPHTHCLHSCTHAFTQGSVNPGPRSFVPMFCIRGAVIVAHTPTPESLSPCGLQACRYARTRCWGLREGPRGWGGVCAHTSSPPQSRPGSGLAVGWRRAPGVARGSTQSRDAAARTGPSALQSAERKQHFSQWAAATPVLGAAVPVRGVGHACHCTAQASARGSSAKLRPTFQPMARPQPAAAISLWLPAWSLARQDSSSGSTSVLSFRTLTTLHRSQIAANWRAVLHACPWC